jgi:hypothetical protein
LSDIRCIPMAHQSTCLRLSPELLAAVDARAEHLDVSRAEIIRRLLRQALGIGELVIQEDSGSANWSFSVPGLGVVGGAESKEDAYREALQAIRFTLGL